MQYVSFDYLCWVLTAYFVVRLLRKQDPRWWLGVGLSVGLGMMAKYSMAFFAFGILLAFLGTGARTYLRSKWLVFGIALALLIFLPNFIWQAQHHFVSLDFLRYIHARDMRIGRTSGFLPDQLKLTLLHFHCGLQVWASASSRREPNASAQSDGCTSFRFSSSSSPKAAAITSRRPIPCSTLPAACGSSSESHPCIASGRVPQNPSCGLHSSLTFFLAAVLLLPIAPINSSWWATANKVNGDFREELGWQELADTVASIRDSLPPEDRTSLGILAGNYGEAGAINLYGPDHGFPVPSAVQLLLVARLSRSAATDVHRRGLQPPLSRRAFFLLLCRRTYIQFLWS